MKNESLQNNIQSVQKFLEGVCSTYRFDPQNNQFWMPFMNAQSKFAHQFVVFRVEEDCVQLYIDFPVLFPRVSFPKVQKYIVEQTSRMKNGCFQLDPMGLLRFHIFIDCYDRTPSEEVLTHSLACACAMLDLHAADLFRLALDEEVNPEPSFSTDFLDPDSLAELLDRVEKTAKSDIPAENPSDEDEADEEDEDFLNFIKHLKQSEPVEAEATFPEDPAAPETMEDAAV